MPEFCIPEIEENSPYNIVIGAGGGAGSVMAPGFVEALGKDFHVSIAVPMGDGGSKTGELRTVFGGPAVGDVRKILSAVSGNELGPLFGMRFGEEADADTIRMLGDSIWLGALARNATEADLSRMASVLDRTADSVRELPHGLRGHTLGNLILTTMRLDYGGDIMPAVVEASGWLDARAEVIPITAEAHDVVMWDGKQVVRGEGIIDSHRVADPSQVRIWLENADGNPPLATWEALTAIQNSHTFVIGPGSHLTSLLPLELPQGVAQAVAEQGKRGGSVGTVVNLVAEDHAMPSMNVGEHVRILEGPLGRPLDYFVYNTEFGDLPDGKVPVGCDAEHVSRVAALAIGANLVDSHIVTRDPNDPIAHLRSDVHHNPIKIVRELQSNRVLPLLDERELVTA